MNTRLACSVILLVAASVAAASAQEADDQMKLKHPDVPETVESGRPDFSAMLENLMPGDLFEVAANDGRFKTFLAAVKAAGLEKDLEGKAPYTVFAPTDKAFAKLPAGTIESLLQPANRDRLAAILSNHIVPGRVKPNEAGALLVTSLADAELVLRFDHGHWFVGDAEVIGPALVADNGTIRPIDTVLMPAPPGEHAHAEGHSGQ